MLSAKYAKLVPLHTLPPGLVLIMCRLALGTKWLLASCMRHVPAAAASAPATAASACVSRLCLFRSPTEPNSDCATRSHKGSDSVTLHLCASGNLPARQA